MLNNIYKSCLMIFMCFTYLSCIAEEFSYYQEKQKSTHSHTIERKNSSACTTHCGIRTEISSNYQTPKSYSNYNRSYYASLSPTDFKYLLHNICDTNEVLNQYPLYAFENFLIFARTLPDYQAHILSLNQKIQRDKNFKKQTAYMPYFDYSFGIGYEKSEFHDLIATEAQKIIKNQPKQNSFTPQTSRHIQTNTLQYNDLILKKLNSRYSEKIKTINDSNISIRLIDRINVINQIYKSKPKHFDYSEQIAQLHLNYDNEKIFQNTYGTQLDYQLHKELCQTRSTLFSLERTYSYNHHIQTLAPIVYNYTTQAKQETCPITAFELSDFCHLITQVLSQGMKALYHTSLAIDNGIQQGISEFCSVKHWQDMATGAMHFGLLFADAIGKEDALHYAMILNATSNDSEPLINAAKQYCKYTQEQKDALNLGLHNTYKKIQSTSWPDIVEHGVQIGSTIILDILTFNAINGFSRTASNLAIKQLSNSLEGATLLTKEYMVEVAGFGKLIIEEGPEVTTVASDTIKNDFTFFKKRLIRSVRRL